MEEVTLQQIFEAGRQHDAYKVAWLRLKSNLNDLIKDYEKRDSEQPLISVARVHIDAKLELLNLITEAMAFIESELPEQEPRP